MEAILYLTIMLIGFLGLGVLSYYAIKSRHLRRVAIITLSGLILAIIFVIGDTVSKSNTKSTIQTVNSERNLIRMINRFNERSNQGGIISFNNRFMMEATMDDKAASGGYEPVDYSKTNKQVEGVDEADLVKTDGRYIYEVGYREVFIVNAYPEDSLELNKTINYDDEDFTPRELYIDEDYLVVIGDHIEEVKVKYDDNIRYGNIEKGFYTRHDQHTRAYIYDKKNDFELLHTYNFDGRNLTSRKIDNKLYLMTIKYANRETEDKTRAPRYSVDGNETIVDYDDIYYIEQTNPSNFITVAAINLDQVEDELDVFTILGSGHNVYMSKNTLYIVENQYNYTILNRITNETNHNRYSVITKLNLKDGKTDYVGTAKVPGTIINQFSMDEYEGNFRIVTTKGNTWDESSTNNLYILDEDLSQIGSVEGLAKGERIQSSRFVGDRIYMITFRQIDPFFVIDASNPNEPEVLGELKIPGFSTYLHPYDDNHVIGFGFEGNDDGRITGLKMALYDVTDPTNPVEKHKETFLYEDHDYISSEVNYNHKALLFNKEKNILAFPIAGWEKKTVTIEENGSTYTDIRSFYKQTYVVYGLDIESGFMKRGELSHFEANENSQSYRIDRGLYIEDSLYTVSKGKIQVNDLNTLDLVNELELPISEAPLYTHWGFID